MTELNGSIGKQRKFEKLSPKNSEKSSLAYSSSGKGRDVMACDLQEIDIINQLSITLNTPYRNQ